MSIETPPSVETKRNSSLASIDFIFNDHSPENLSKIVDALIKSNGDIIAIEKIREGSFGMGTAEEKAELSRRMTEFISSDSGITTTATEYLGAAEPLLIQLLDRLEGSGKRIVIIDMGTDDPGYTIYRKSVELRQQYIEKLNEFKGGGKVSIEELEDMALDCKIAIAQSFEYREHVMEKQLREIAESNPGLKISVMMGAIHTPVSHNMGSDFDISHAFVPTDKDEALYPRGVKMNFDSNMQQIRTIRFRLGELGLSVVDSNETPRNQG